MNRLLNHSRRLVAALLAAGLMATGSAHARGVSEEASTMSTFGLSVTVLGPLSVIAGAGMLSVVAVEKAGDGVVWIVENAADGSRATLQLSGAAAGGLSVAAGTAVAVTACSAGWLLSTAGQVVAFIPNELGKALLYNEKVIK